MSQDVEKLKDLLDLLDLLGLLIKPTSFHKVRLSPSGSARLRAQSCATSTGPARVSPGHAMWARYIYYLMLIKPLHAIMVWIQTLNVVHFCHFLLCTIFSKLRQKISKLTRSYVAERSARRVEVGAIHHFSRRDPHVDEAALNVCTFY
jgi:hypothetical protein